MMRLEVKKMARTRGGLAYRRRSVRTRKGLIRTHEQLAFGVSPSQAASSPLTQDAETEASSPLTQGPSSPVTQDAGSIAVFPVDEPSTKSIKSTNIKRRRGRTTLMNSYRNLPDGAKHEIILNENGQPMLGPVTKLSNAIGVEARTIPVTYMTWTNVPESVKESLYRHILEKYSFGGGDCLDWVLKTANGAWKREKKKIRDERVIGRSLDEALLNMPFGYEKVAWRKFCIVWKSKKYKEKCKTAKLSRSHLELSHSLGSTSIAFVKANSGKNGMSLFELIHSKKSGEPTNKVVSNVIASVANSTSNLPPTFTNEERDAARDEALLDVVGRKKHSGRVWGWGKGVTDTSLRLNSTKSSSSTTYSASSLVELINEMNLRENEWKLKFEEMEQREKIREDKFQWMEEREKAREVQFQEIIARVKFLESLMAVSGCRPFQHVLFDQNYDGASCSFTDQ